MQFRMISDNICAQLYHFINDYSLIQSISNKENNQTQASFVISFQNLTIIINLCLFKKIDVVRQWGSIHLQGGIV